MFEIGSKKVLRNTQRRGTDILNVVAQNILNRSP